MLLVKSLNLFPYFFAFEKYRLGFLPEPNLKGDYFYQKNTPNPENQEGKDFGGSLCLEWTKKNFLHQ